MKDVVLKKYDYIDALKGIAILGVLLVHATHLIAPASEYFAMVAAEGARGVQLFFFISALTTFFSMQSRIAKEKKPVLNFFIRRFFRIAPLFYTAIIFYSLYHTYTPVYWAPNGMKWWFFPLTALFIHGWHPETINSVVPNGWAITVEFSFYFMLPWLFVKINNLGRSVWFVIISLITAKVFTFTALKVITNFYPESQHYIVGSFTFLWIFSQLPVFALGIVFYHMIKNNTDWQDKSMGIVFLVLSVILFAAFLQTKTFGNLLPHHFLWGIAFFMLTLALFLYPNKIMVNAFTKTIGKLSYSIYLCHYAVILFFKDIHLEKLFSQGPGGFGIGFMAILAGSVIVSALSYFIIEKPGIRLGQRLIHRLN